MRPCKNCGCDSSRLDQVTFKDGTEHFKRSCNQCNKFIDWGAEELPDGFFILPFGKYKDFSIDSVCDIDPEYAEYFIKKFGRGKVVSRIKKVLASMRAEQKMAEVSKQKR